MAPVPEKSFTIRVSDEEFSPIVKRDLEWARDHIIESGSDYCKSKRKRDALVKALGLVIDYYSPNRP